MMMMTILCRRQRFRHSFLKSIHPMSRGCLKSLFYYYFGSHSIHLLGLFALILFYTCHLSWECHQSPLQSLAPDSYCCRLMSPNQIVWNIFPKYLPHICDSLWTIHTTTVLSAVRHWTIATEYRSGKNGWWERKKLDVWMFFSYIWIKNG